MGTAIASSSSQLTYLANFRRTATRVRACAKILADHRLRLGRKYLGPKTMWASRRHSFVHSMAETKELIAEAGTDLKGFLESLVEIGYDGPIRAEPFNCTVDQMDDDAACAETASAMRSAIKLVGASVTPISNWHIGKVV